MMQNSGLPLLKDVLDGKHDHQLPTRVQEITRRYHSDLIPIGCGYIVCSHCLKVKRDDGKKQCLNGTGCNVSAKRQPGGGTTVTRGSSANPAVSLIALHHKDT